MFVLAAWENRWTFQEELSKIRTGQTQLYTINVMFCMRKINLYLMIKTTSLEWSLWQHRPLQCVFQTDMNANAYTTLKAAVVKIPPKSCWCHNTSPPNCKSFAAAATFWSCFLDCVTFLGCSRVQHHSTTVCVRAHYRCEAWLRVYTQTQPQLHIGIFCPCAWLRWEPGAVTWSTAGTPCVLGADSEGRYRVHCARQHGGCYTFSKLRALSRSLIMCQNHWLCACFVFCFFLILDVVKSEWTWNDSEHVN